MGLGALVLDLGLPEDMWLEILRPLNILLNTEWKTVEELKKLDKPALDEYCEPWADATDRLGELVYDFCENLNDKSNLDSSNLLHNIYQSVKTLSPVFYEASGAWDRLKLREFNFIYVVLHPDSDEYKQHLKEPHDIGKKHGNHLIVFLLSLFKPRKRYNDLFEFV